LEYWSFFVYQLIQFGVRNANHIEQVRLLEGLGADDVDLRILATSPSSTAKLMPTRLRSSGVMVVVTFTA
jgi:hypothetical protein